MAYQISTLSTLQARLGEKYESVPFWTAEEGRLALNETLRMWNLLVGFWKTRVELTTVANQVWYVPPSPILYPLRVDFELAPMVQTPLFDLDLGRPLWEGETTASPDAPQVPTLWVPAGFTLFAIWPADALGQRSLVVDGITHAPILTLPGDFIDIGEEEVNVFLGYALHILTFKVGGTRFADTIPLYKAFLQHALLRNDRLLVSKAFRALLAKSTRRDSVPGPAAVVPSA